MTIGTIVPWAQLALGGIIILNTYTAWRAGRAGGRDGMITGVMSLVLGISMLTTGWVRNSAWIVLAIGSAFVFKKLFAERDRVSLWITLPFVTMIVVIAVTELLVDDLNEMQKALFATIAIVAVTLVATMIGRLATRTRRT